MWTNAHASHAENPLSLTNPASRMAKRAQSRPCCLCRHSGTVWRGTPGLALGNHFAHEAPLLHGHLRDAGQRFAILIE